MIDYTYADLYYEGSINKQLNIEAEDGTVINNPNIYQEAMSLEETLCSEESLTFGCCEASVFKLKIANQFTSLYGQKLTVSETIDGNTDEPFQFGIYKVVEDTPTADRIYRNITAYDAMYDIINADATAVAEWYNTILPDEDSTVTMKEFRTSFLALFDIEQEDITLANDDMMVEKTIDTDSLSGKDVICAICEINGCFGHIGRDGKFQYIYLEQISEDESEAAILGTMVLGSAKLGSTGTGTDIGHSNYKSCDYEDYTTTAIDKLQIRQEENDAGCTYGDGDNCYIIEGNFLVYGKGSDELSEIAANIYEKIAGISYRPTSGIVAIGNPCIEVGDGIFLSTKYQDIATYVLQRTLEGIQALEDTYEANGTETCENTGNSLESTITQLKGKTNVLTRTVEETKSQISDVEEGLTNTITQTADSLKSEISKVNDSVSALESAAVTGSVIEYYKSTSATELSGGEWSQAAPEWEDGTYIWMRTTVTYGTDESSLVTVTTDPVCITGNTGAQGEQGIQGLQGIQGEQGEQGIQGETGADGKTSYFHIKYSDVENPTSSDEMTETPSDYIGTYVDYTEDDSNDPSDYTWMKWVGEDGEQGIQGVKGDDGTTYYLHIAYANSEDGSTDFSTSDSTGKSYIGQYTDTEIDDSTDYTAYSWTKIKGDTGENGISVVSITAYYAVSESNSYYPSFGDDGTASILGTMILGTAVLGNSAEWSETMPDVEDNEYLWIAFLVTYSDNSTQWTEPCLLTDESTRNAITILQEQNSTFEQTLESFEFTLSSLDSVVTENYEYTETRMSEFEVTLEGLSATASETLEQVGTLQSEAVTGTVTEYYKSISPTECSGGTWTEDTVEWEEGYYIWVRTTVTTGVGDAAVTTTSDPVCITGNTGATGSSGNDGASVTISSTAITYQASSSGTAAPTGTWSSSIPSVSKGQYLWTRTVVTYTLTASDGTTSTKSTTSYSVAYIGEDGAQGEQGEKGDTGESGADGASVTIQSTKITYQATSSGTETPSGDWSESVPEMEAGQYLWTRTVVTYLLTASDGTTSTKTTTSYSISYIGVDGADGEDGADGADGVDGVSVESVTIYYALSESSTYAPSHGDDGTTAVLGTMVLGAAVLGNSGEWYTEAPEVGETEYLWSCFLITYSNGVTSWTEPCCLTDDSTRNLVSTLNERVYEFEASLDGFLYSLESLQEDIYTNYSTTEEIETTINAKIEDSEASITSSIEATYATMEYADDAASTATTSANDYTDGLLTSYYNIEQTNSIIQTVTEEINEISLSVSSVKTTVDGTIKTYKVYYAVSESPDYYPTHGDDGTTSVLGTGTLGSMVLGNSGEWTETQPEAADGEYIWVSYYIEYADDDCTTEWTKPTLITDTVSRDGITSLTEKSAELTVSLDGISAQVSSVETEVYSNYTELIEKYSELVLADDSISASVSEAITTANGYTDSQITAGLVLEIAEDSSGTSYGKLSANADYIEFESKQFVITSDQFSIDADGNATFGGSLNAATGTFSGDVYATSFSLNGATMSMELRTISGRSISTGHVYTDWSVDREVFVIDAEGGIVADGYVSFNDAVIETAYITSGQIYELITGESYINHLTVQNGMELYGTPRFYGELYFGSNDYFIYAHEYGGLYCSGMLATVDAIYVGNVSYTYNSESCMLNVNGNSYLNGVVYCSDMFSVNGKALIGNTSYGDYMLNVKGGSYLSGSLTVTGSIQGNSGIELYHSTPFIDFHYGSSSADYTSRIIEKASGVLTVTGSLTVDSALTVTGTTRLNGGNYLAGATFSAGAVFNDYVTVNSTLTAADTITSNAATGFTLGYGNYDVMLRNDGSAFYLLLSDSGGTTWNSLRPFFVNLSTGYVTIQTGLTASIACTDGTYRTPIGSAPSSGYRVTYLSLPSTSTAHIHGDGGGSSFAYDCTWSVSSSDVRLKSNIADCTVESLPVIRQIQLREFDWTYENRHQDIGMVADEVELIDSNLAIGGGWNKDDDSMCVKAIDTFYLIGYIVGAIQELDTTQTEHEKRIAELEAQIAELQAQIAVLQASAV